MGYLAVADPHDPKAIMPRCPIKVVTGWDCPSCGGSRMVRDVLHGDMRGAVADNAFLALASPVLVFVLYKHACAVRDQQPLELPPLLPRRLLIAAVVWAVVRNLPGWPWKPGARHQG